MQAGFSSFIIIFTILNILACFWLLWWNRRRPQDEGKETTGHVWDEDIREYNKPMPRWWLNLFVLSIVWGLAYLIAYPGLGAYSGALAWSSVQEHALATAEIDGRIAQAFSGYHNAPLTQLVNDPVALKLGQSIYVNTCAACHGADARGAPGFPDLTDRDWLYGGDPDVVLTSILGGRAGLMPSWETALGTAGVTEVTAYVRQLSGQSHNAEAATAGATRYQMFCLSCHGADGKGNTTLGAPNLTDDIWLYGGTDEAIAESVRKGRQGQMPAHGDLIGEDRARVVAAYVLSLGNKPAARQGDAGSATQD